MKLQRNIATNTLTQSTKDKAGVSEVNNNLPGRKLQNADCSWSNGAERYDACSDWQSLVYSSHDQRCTLLPRRSITCLGCTALSYPFAHSIHRMPS